MPPAATANERTAPDPYKDGPGYLEHHGWKRLGLPSSPTARYLDPTKPARRQTRYVEVKAVNDEGKLEPVMAPTGEGEKVAPVRQLVIELPARPLTLEQALEVQLERDSERLLAEAAH